MNGQNSDGSSLTRLVTGYCTNKMRLKAPCTRFLQLSIKKEVIMQPEYLCVVKLKNDSNRWNIDGCVDCCLQQLIELGLEWECIILANSRTGKPVNIIFPYDESLLE